MNTAPLTPDDFSEQMHVSEEMMERLRKYVALLEKWQRRINLVGRGTLDDIWRRHVLDSYQLISNLPHSAREVIDLGSGAGFPGIIMGMTGRVRVHLVESDSRKCAFLREAIRITGADANVQQCRIEALRFINGDVVTARACAPLTKLMDYAWPLLDENGICLFLKGRNAEEELTVTMKNWKMRITRIRSLSDPAGMILKLEGITRHHDG